MFWLWVLLLAALAIAVALKMQRTRRVRERLLGPQVELRPERPERPARAASDDATWQERFSEWLASAGYEGSAARIQFGLWLAAAVLTAAFFGLTLDASGFGDQAVIWLEGVPGGIAEVFVPVMLVAAWLLALLVALTPIVWVRRRRRQRQDEVERDLPYVLSLLATLVESGLGFDAAAMRVERSLGPGRVLSAELGRVRASTLAGAPRATAIRAMARRLDVASLTAFSSALIHAENQGASIGETLRRQSVDLWARRREEAIQKAQTLPTKLAFPLVVCFLPGVFVWTFGPAVAEFVRLAGDAIPVPS